MLSAAVQVLAFGLALLGVLGAAAATLLPNWKVSATNVWSGAMTPVSRMQGLWMDCVCYSSGVFGCSVKSSVLSLPVVLQAARAGMVLSCAVASLGLCLAALGLRCTRWGGGRRAKALTAVSAGGCFLLAGLLCLGPASWYTGEVVAAFLATDLPDSSKYQPGGALCVAFLSAGLLLAGGVVFCMSCPGSGTGRPGGGDPDRPAAARGRRPQTENPPPKRRQNKTVRLQVDKAKRQNPPEPEEVDPSPSRAPKDLKDRYSRQEYV